MAFHEKWFVGSQQRAYREVLSMVPPGDGALVEVGVWEGRSTIILAQAFPGEKVHAVDHWQGDLTNLRNGVAQLAAERDVFADFRENLTEAGVWDQVVVHRSDWRKVFASWRAPIRMLFIDAQHTYDEVADNIDAGRPFMVPGGIMCGDDYSNKEVRKAVHDRLGDDAKLMPGAKDIWVWKAP